MVAKSTRACLDGPDLLPSSIVFQCFPALMRNMLVQRVSRFLIELPDHA